MYIFFLPLCSNFKQWFQRGETLSRDRERERERKKVLRSAPLFITKAENEKRERERARGVLEREE